MRSVSQLNVQSEYLMCGYMNSSSMENWGMGKGFGGTEFVV